jgi:hypothetical protein
VSRPVVLGLTLLIGAVALLVLWRTPTGRARSNRAEPDVAPREQVESSAPLSTPLTEESGGSEAAPPAIASVPGTEHHAAQRSASLDERPRISGIVRIPNGVPAAEPITVRAEVFPSGGSDDPRKLATRAANDGSFAFAVPENTGEARLTLESRFLALDEPVEARPGDTSVDLEPFACAIIEGEVVLPLSQSSQGANWEEVRISWLLDRYRNRSVPDARSAMRSPSNSERVVPDHDGAFELLFVPAGGELELHAENPFGPEWIQHIDPLAPGEKRRVTIALELGVTIAGRVIDEHGSPVEREDVTAYLVESNGDRLRWLRSSAKTDAEGRFVLERMPRRTVQVITKGEGIAREGEAIVDAAVGDVGGLVITVVRGGCIEGTVRWANGRPVDAFEIHAKGPRETGKYLEGSHFRLGSLLEGSYRVEVRAERSGVVGTASADVQTGSTPIELVLQETQGFDLNGVVVDEHDKPIKGFSVDANLSGPRPRFESAVERPDGSFVLSGLEGGEWTVAATAVGYQSSLQHVTLAGSSPAPLRIVLARAGRIRGRVLDATGAPVANAWVREVVGAYFPPLSDSEDDGRFEIKVSSTHPRLLAGKSGFSPSSIVEVEVASGQDAEGIVLQLRPSCRVEGRVFDTHGEPVTDARIRAAPNLGSSTVKTNARGSFTLDDLAPGSVLLIASHPSIEGALASASVDLAPGHTSSVELRFEEPDPVRVHGRITREGKPIACKLALRSRSFSAECTSGADGRFEVTLRQPGAWMGAVCLASEELTSRDLRRFDVRRLDLAVPDADEHTLEFVFETLPRLSSFEELFR